MAELRLAELPRSRAVGWRAVSALGLLGVGLGAFMAGNVFADRVLQPGPSGSPVPASSTVAPSGPAGAGNGLPDTMRDRAALSEALSQDTGSIPARGRTAAPPVPAPSLSASLLPAPAGGTGPSAPATPQAVGPAAPAAQDRSAMGNAVAGLAAESLAAESLDPSGLTAEAPSAIDPLVLQSIEATIEAALNSIEGAKDVKLTYGGSPADSAPLTAGINAGRPWTPAPDGLAETSLTQPPDSIGQVQMTIRTRPQVTYEPQE